MRVWFLFAEAVPAEELVPQMFQDLLLSPNPPKEGVGSVS